MLKQPELFQQGYHITHVTLPDSLRNSVENSDWAAVNNSMTELLSKNGSLYQFLQQYHAFQDIDFIIAVRDAKNDWEEDGIWHDDGTRVFAFSLSLTLGAVEGGRLGFRRRGEDAAQVLIPTPGFGSICMFLTGIYGFEHKIHQVTKGRRVIIAGWCT